MQTLNKVLFPLLSLLLVGYPPLPPPPSPSQLDAGVQENVLLHSRDEQSVLVVSYADLKSCLETTFTELLSSAQPDT